MTTQLQDKERAKLREFLVRRFDLNELKVVAFDLGVSYDVLPHGNSTELSMALISYFEHRENLGCLLTEVLRQRPDDELARLLAKLPSSSPRKQVQIIVSPDVSAENADALLLDLSMKLKVNPEQISLIAAAPGTGRLLLGMPQGVADVLVTSGIRDLVNGRFSVVSVVAFDSLDKGSQEAWRTIADRGSGSLVRWDSLLHPDTSQEDLLDPIRKAPVFAVHDSSLREEGRTGRSMRDYDFQWTLLAAILMCLDALAVWGGLTLAYTIRLSGRLLTYSGAPNEVIYQALALISIPVWITLFALTGLYRRDTLLGGVAEYQRALRACTTGVMTLIVLSLVSRDLVMISRGWLVVSWGLSSILIVLERFFMRHVVRTLRRRGYFTARVLIIGVSEQGAAIARQWSQSPTSGMQVVGFVDDFKPIGTPVVCGLTVIGRPTALSELVRKTRANEVVVVPNAVAWETFEEIISRAGTQNDYALRLSPGLYELLTTGVAVTNKAFVPLLTVNATRIVGWDAVFKTLLDYGLGIPLFILAAPVMVLVAMGLKIVRPDKPVFAHFQTIGQRGTTFVMLKFATSIESLFRVNSSKGSIETVGSGASWIERALYRSGLDKLPQLFNVLAGQMSLVGPRPRVVNEEATSNAACNLQTVKPGFIGPWMISGHSDPQEETLDELYYVRNWTIWTDLQILVHMFLHVISMFWHHSSSPRMQM